MRCVALRRGAGQGAPALRRGDARGAEKAARRVTSRARRARSSTRGRRDAKKAARRVIRGAGQGAPALRRGDAKNGAAERFERHWAKRTPVFNAETHEARGKAQFPFDAEKGCAWAQSGGARV
jgi:hypothetical protein